MDIHITELLEAIDFSKRDFAEVVAQYNIEFPPCSVNRDEDLDSMLHELEQVHAHFDSLWYTQPLRMEDGITSKQFLAKLRYWGVANLRCCDKLEPLKRRYLNLYRLLFWVEEHESALGNAMRQLERAHYNFRVTCNEVMHSINAMIDGLQLGRNANAVQLPIQPHAAEPVVANVSEEHNMAAIPEPKEMVECNSNTSASEDPGNDN